MCDRKFIHSIAIISIIVSRAVNFQLNNTFNRSSQSEKSACVDMWRRRRRETKRDTHDGDKLRCNHTHLSLSLASV
jgi:hypothetical protein